jgi:hypothetical protein
MSASSTLFLSMSEEYYLMIPEDFREAYLRDKIYSQDQQDFSELMEDTAYNALYKEHKKVKAQLEERAYQLRENKRKQLKQE